MADEVDFVKLAIASRLVCAVFALGLSCAGAHAQDSQDAPPGSIRGEDSVGDSGELTVRVDRLEGQLRRATGQIEELQNANRKLDEQLKRFREDVEFRLNNKSGSIPPQGETVGALPAGPVTHDEPLAPRSKKSDVFDPSANPGAVGAPKPLGSTSASSPLDLGSRPPAADPDVIAALPSREKKPDEPAFVSSGVPFADSREQFKSAVAAFQAGQYADSEAQFKAYLAANPGSTKAPDAIFYIGETYLQRSRPREAAEQYLKISTDYGKSSRAPEGMMRLGQALAMLGNSEQACATFAVVGKRYPTAPSSVKRTVDREMQTHHCQ